ncbi:MAG: hypothetical protein QNJ75_11930 [Acidimicrobiia bacterium]|nr:hypothetical protein [Acidimicrobiia bacterium]
MLSLRLRCRLIGSTYATLFPERVRAMVLDSAFDLSASLDDFIVARAEASERALTLVLEQCAADSVSAFHNDGDPFIAFDELMERLDAEPLMVDDTEVGLVHAMDAMFFGLIWEENWSYLTRALAEAQDGNVAGCATSPCSSRSPPPPTRLRQHRRGGRWLRSFTGHWGSAKRTDREEELHASKPQVERR